MSKIKKPKIKALILLLFIAQASFAIELIQTEQFITPEGEILTKETWISAQTINIDGEASNDLFAVAAAINLDGTFHGDVWGGGETVGAAGIFRDDVRLMSRTVQVAGTFHKSLTAIGNTIKIERTAILHKNMLCLGENVIVEGSVDGNVRIMAQRVTLGGQIGGNVSLVTREISVLPGTVINGDLTYTAPKELVLSPSVILNGELTREFETPPTLQIFKSDLITHFIFGLAALVTGLVLIGLFPHYTGASLHALRTARGLSGLIGFVALFMLPVTASLLLLTLIGLPLSILLFLFYFILLYLSKIVVALALGSAILRRREFSKRTAVAPLALGLLIIYALTSLAAVSLLINILIAILGLGALLLALFKKPVLIIQTPGTVNETNKEN